VARRLSQLSDFRDRLTHLAKRPEVRIEELIKAESELASIQRQIEALTAQQRQLAQRIDMELLTVDFRSRATLGSVGLPIERAWSQASATLGASTASALSFLIAALPWVPIVAVGAFLFGGLFVVVRWIVRRLGRPPAT
jgi:hypothetical protein